MIEKRADRRQAHLRQYKIIRNSLLFSIREALAQDRTKDALLIVKRLQAHVLGYKYHVGQFT
jgi:hypothetical protein